jgi:hypothetical protein
MPLFDKALSWSLVVQDNTQEGFVDVDLAVVLDETQFPEFVHEKIDPGPRCAKDLQISRLCKFEQHAQKLSNYRSVFFRTVSGRLSLLR